MIHVQQGAVFQEIRPEFFGDRKNTMPVVAVDHLINVFNLRRTGMKSIKDFFVMIAEDFLENVHKIIMKKKGTKENPKPLMIEGQGS